MLSIAGFSEPSDAEADDIELWMPRMPLMEPILDLTMAKYMITNVGDKFCEMVEQEKEAMSWVSPDSKYNFLLSWNVSPKERMTTGFDANC